MEFAIAKAGHDRRKIYQIAAEDETCVYLVNGTTRTFDNPKKKNKSHIQVIRKLPEEVLAIMEQDVEVNHRIRKAIKCLEQHIYKNKKSENERV